MRLFAISAACLSLALFTALLTSIAQDIPPVILTSTVSAPTNAPLDWNPGMIPTQTLQPTSIIPPAVATYEASLFTPTPTPTPQITHVRTIEPTPQQPSGFLSQLLRGLTSINYGEITE